MRPVSARHPPSYTLSQNLPEGARPCCLPLRLPRPIDARLPLQDPITSPAPLLGPRPLPHPPHRAPPRDNALTAAFWNFQARPRSPDGSGEREGGAQTARARESSVTPGGGGERPPLRMRPQLARAGGGGKRWKKRGGQNLEPTNDSGASRDLGPRRTGGGIARGLKGGVRAREPEWRRRKWSEDKMAAKVVAPFPHTRPHSSFPIPHLHVPDDPLSAPGFANLYFITWLWASAVPEGLGRRFRLQGATRDARSGAPRVGIGGSRQAAAGWGGLARQARQHPHFPTGTVGRQPPTQKCKAPGFSEPPQDEVVSGPLRGKKGEPAFSEPPTPRPLPTSV